MPEAPANPTPSEAPAPLASGFAMLVAVALGAGAGHLLALGATVEGSVMLALAALAVTLAAIAAGPA